MELVLTVFFWAIMAIFMEWLKSEKIKNSLPLPDKPPLPKTISIINVPEYNGEFISYKFNDSLGLTMTIEFLPTEKWQGDKIGVYSYGLPAVPDIDIVLYNGMAYYKVRSGEMITLNLTTQPPPLFFM